MRGPRSETTRPLSQSAARAWVRSWDRQQTLYVRMRERRFEVMFDALESYLSPRFIALDVGCGPGSLSQRLLERFPQARVVALDYDPVLLELGRTARLVDPRRVRWVEADLRRADWVKGLPVRKFDAVLSTTALHWLLLPELRRTYRAFHDLLRPGGIFLNGDAFPYGRSRPIFRSIATTTSQRWHYRGVRAGALDWGSWWAALERRPDLHREFLLRRERFPKAEHNELLPTVEEQERYLRSAGFTEPTIVWRDFTVGVLMAVRPPRAPKGDRTGRLEGP